MPKRAARICSAPGCGRLIRGNTRRCPLHETPRPKPKYPRESPHRRGYGRDWQKRRARILKRDPVCRSCFVNASTEVDHILPKRAGGTDSDENLQGLCTPCHSSKTAREDGGFGNRRRSD